jgi:predicted RNA-binding protein associated with RNAse of E/G family
LIVLAHHVKPKSPIVIDGAEALVPGDLAIWFLFKGEPFDIARIYSPRGQFRGYYVDALEPVRWDGSDPHSLETLVDLYLDMWIWPRRGYSILDEDELAAAQEDGHISSTQAHNALATIASIANRIAIGSFPPEPVREFNLRSSVALALVTGVNTE